MSHREKRLGPLGPLGRPLGPLGPLGLEWRHLENKFEHSRSTTGSELQPKNAHRHHNHIARNLALLSHSTSPFFQSTNRATCHQSNQTSQKNLSRSPGYRSSCSHGARSSSELSAILPEIARHSPRRGCSAVWHLVPCESPLIGRAQEQQESGQGRDWPQWRPSNYQSFSCYSVTQNFQ